jgi:ferric-chelate reductase
MSTDEEGSRAFLTQKSTVVTSINHWIRTYLIIPAAFGTHHQRLFWWCVIPTRMEAVMVAAFWILNLVMCCVSYEIFSPNL